jgi:hypothetical protein
MVTSTEEIKNEIDALRRYVIEKKDELSWLVEGVLLDYIDKLKAQLYLTELTEKSASAGSSPHVLEMRTKFPGPNR